MIIILTEHTSFNIGYQDFITSQVRQGNILSSYFSIFQVQKQIKGWIFLSCHSESPFPALKKKPTRKTPRTAVKVQQLFSLKEVPLISGILNVTWKYCQYLCGIRPFAVLKNKIQNESYIFFHFKSVAPLAFFIPWF